MSNTTEGAIKAPMSKTSLYGLVTLYKLIVQGLGSRVYRQAKAENLIAETLRNMLPAECRDHVRVLPATHEDAIEALGKE